MRTIQRARKGSGGKTRNEVTINDPTPARLVSLVDEPRGVGGGTRAKRSRRVSVAGGMMRGRFRGFAKNRNTRERGKGTHCSKVAWQGMDGRVTSWCWNLRRFKRHHRLAVLHE